MDGSASPSVEALTRLGLTEYAAKAYVALVSLGEADAESVAARSGVPRTKVYDALDELGSRGWARDEGGRPRKWRPESPQACVARERAQLDALLTASLTDLEAQFERRAVRIVGSVWVLEGDDAIDAKRREMLARAARQVLVAFPAGAPPDDAVLRELRAAARRNVRVQVMVGDSRSASDRLLAVPAEVRVVPVPAHILFVDMREGLVQLPGPEGPRRAIWNPTPELAALMASMGTGLWATGLPWPEPR